ncbi:MAG TPA: hypothetical protein VKK31_12940 [Thermoanaerobaculia bacterium]|nr:hypothetical protein [Thermoanaerobaculia bacterium]
MKKQWFLVSLMLCLTLFGAHLSFAQGSDDTLTLMQQQGWKIVREGVLQRELIAGEVESFVFGVPGFTWKLQDLQKQLQKLQAALKATPTPELRQAIANHRKEIANTRKTLALARLGEANGESGIEKVSCNIGFGYNASASSLNPGPGTFGNATANFSSNCAFSGEVYAYAFAKTTVNGAPTTHTVTDGPRAGANVSATAYATVNGGPPCDSNAYGSMTSNSLNPSSYSMQVTNPSSCPGTTVPDPTISLVVSPTSTSTAPIDLDAGYCITVTWTASPSGGSTPTSTTITVNGVSQGVRTTYSASYCGTNTNTTRTIPASATVTDSLGRTATASTTTYIRSHREIIVTCIKGTSGATVCP